MTPPAPRVGALERAIRDDLRFLDAHDRLHGAGTLAVLALELARQTDAAARAGDTVRLTRLGKELRATMSTLGRPDGDDDDRRWLADLSAPVGDTPEP